MLFEFEHIVLAKPTNCSRTMASTQQKDIVLLINGTVQELSAKELCMKSYPHPKGYVMLVIDLNNQLYELQRTQPRKYSSWFINQRVCSGQDVYMANVLDPRFLCLPFLEKSTRFSPLDQIVIMDEKYSRFPFSRVAEWKMQDMCDVNDKFGDDMILYRYNEAKVIDWLKLKVIKVAAAVRKQRMAKAQAHNTVFAIGFNSSKQTTGVMESASGVAITSVAADAPSREDLVTALEVVTDYLTPACAEKLLAAYDMSAGELNSSKASAAANLKRKADWEQELELEKETLAFSAAASKVNTLPGSGSAGDSAAAKFGSSSGGSSSGNQGKASGANSAVKASVKANQVAAKGTKSIQSFFGGKK